MRFSSTLNPGLPDYPDFIAGEAVRSQLSPDGTTLAVITAGQNSLYRPNGTVDAANSTQYIFLYDVEGANKARPSLTQVIKQMNAHVGSSSRRMATRSTPRAATTTWCTSTRRAAAASRPPAPIALGHFAPGATGSARNRGIGLSVQPNASGMDISADGTTLVVANNYNDSISVIDTATRVVRYEHDLRPFFAGNEGQNGGAGGTFPFAVVMKGNDTAYVSSDRDREVVVVDVSSPTQGRLIKRIRLDGNALGMTLDASQSQALRGAGQRRSGRGDRHVDQPRHRQRSTRARRPACCRQPEIHRRGDLRRDALSRRRHALRGQQRRRTPSPSSRSQGGSAHRVSGLIPTAYEPHDITFSADGSWMYIISGKSVTGPNPGHLASSTAQHHQHHLPGRQRGRGGRVASLEPVPVPAGAGVAGQRSGADPARSATT